MFIVQCKNTSQMHEKLLHISTYVEPDAQNLLLVEMSALQPFLAMFCQLHEYLLQSWSSKSHFELLNRFKT